jgi:DNA polymerase (family 10)
MDNIQIAETFAILSQLNDIHGENSFKSKSYAAAAFAIDKLPVNLSEYPKEKIKDLKGIGASSAQKIIELLETGKIQSLEELISKTPSGIIEMLQIKGIGPKKIHTIWKEMEIESLGELLYACKENRLKLFKGFGEKTQTNVAASIEFYFNNLGHFLYAQIEPFANEISKSLQPIFNKYQIDFIGDYKKQLPVIETLSFIVSCEIEETKKLLANNDQFQIAEEKEELLILKSDWNIDIHLLSTGSKEYISKKIEHTSTPIFWNRLKRSIQCLSNDNEESFFTNNGLQWIPPFLRENPDIVDKAESKIIPRLIQLSDIKGIIHCHSHWSDGNDSLEAMAETAIANQFEYLAISDHSKSAFYANGLQIERIRAQHQLIDELNKKYAPFKIFKSIEADILNDGKLDYDDTILSSFDLVIASIHSNLKMTEEKAMDRLIKAIENPYTTILGHLTGRLLLSRPGYPVQHRKIIDACAANKVAIELNAQPSRLDIDWKHIDYALEKNVMISINPDAHDKDGHFVLKYGVMMAQKAMMTTENNLSSFSLLEFENYLSKNKR